MFVSTYKMVEIVVPERRYQPLIEAWIDPRKEVPGSCRTSHRGQQLAVRPHIGGVDLDPAQMGMAVEPEDGVTPLRLGGEELGDGVPCHRAERLFHRLAQLRQPVIFQ